jgi:hypothetical protein
MFERSSNSCSDINSLFVPYCPLCRKSTPHLDQAVPVFTRPALCTKTMSSPTHDSTATLDLTQTLQTRLEWGWWALPEDVFRVIINCQSPPVSGVTLKNLRFSCSGMVKFVNSQLFKMVSLSSARENLEAWRTLTDPTNNHLGLYVEHIYIDAMIFVIHPSIKRYCTLLAWHLKNLSGGIDIPRYSEHSLACALLAKPGFSYSDSTEKELPKAGFSVIAIWLFSKQQPVSWTLSAL